MSLDVYLIIDLESHSFESNIQDDSITYRVEKEAMPKILELLYKYKANATFFTTSSFANKSSSTIQKIHLRNHEIGCHGIDLTAFIIWIITYYQQSLQTLKLNPEHIKSFY